MSIGPRKTPPTEVLVVLPTYNEHQNVVRVVSAVRKLGHDVMIVDDSSPDGTGEIADQLAAADAGVRVLHRHRPQDLQPIVDAARKSGGLALGSRYIPGGSIEGWPLRRWLLSWGANIYCRLLLRVPTRDTTSGYRCYTRDLLAHIGLDEVRSQGYSFQIEMVFRARRLGYKVVEVPIKFEDRIAGASKVSENEVRRALLTVLRLSMGRWRR